VAVVAPPMPLILDDASVSIDDGILDCVTNHLELSPDVTVVTITTLCGETDYPGAVKWSLVLTLEQSFDAGATEEILSGAVEGGVPVSFVIVPYKSQPISATNPSWSGMVIPQPYAPINGDAMGESTIDLEWSVVGQPVKSVTPEALDARLTEIRDAAETRTAARTASRRVKAGTGAKE
jgi:hypothetical protein